MSNILKMTMVGALAGLVACDPVEPPQDGAVGISTFQIENRTDTALLIEYTDGSITSPELITDIVPAQSTVDVLTSSGCFGCWDAPSDAISALTVLDAGDESVILSVDPIVDEDWAMEQLGELEAVYTFTVE